MKQLIKDKKQLEYKTEMGRDGKVKQMRDTAS